ncbi:MFS-type transporter SLC18B1 [Stylophora pistillata]|uniref:MFS-type transporter SLC18B1 n=1 Tax=Stylophora pistillata TaxID=50429 RepID=A0A2B4S8H9_STYPI|nr:MFS-type transporter SLC18B1 [Stylophora pistillata]
MQKILKEEIQEKWTEEETEKLIDLLEKNTCLWDVSTKEYHLRNRREKALSDMSDELDIEARDKGVSGTIVGLLFGSYSFVIFIFSPFCGVLDLQGLLNKEVSMAFVSFRFCDMIADRDAFIVVCFVLRVTSAIGGAAVETSGLSILLDTFPDNVGMVSGMIETCAGAGFSFGPVVGGLLYTVGGFKLPFFVTGGTMIAVIPILALALGKASCFVVCGVAFSCLEPILGPHLKQMGQNPSQIGLAFLWWAGTYTLLAPIVGFIGDKTKCYRSLMIMGFIGFFIGSLLVGPAPFLSFLPAKTIWLVTVAMFTNGILGGFAFVPIISDLIRTLRGVIGPSLAGTLDDHFGFEQSTTALLIFSFTLHEKISLRGNSDPSEREPLTINNRKE